MSKEILVIGKPNKQRTDWEKDWNKLTVKSYNLKTEKYEDEPIVFVNDKSWKKVKNFIQSLLTQQRTELLEKIMVEIEIMRGHKDDKIDYLPLYKFLDKLGGQH